MALWYERLGCVALVALVEGELELQCHGDGILELALLVDEQKEALKSQEQQVGLVLQCCVQLEVMLNEPQLEEYVLQNGVVL